MRKLTELSEEHVTFDQNVRKCNFVLEFLSTRKYHLTGMINGLNGLATLFERLDKP